VINIIMGFRDTGCYRHLPPTAAPSLVPAASSTYEDTIVVRLHLQAAAVLNIR
jgi:hypothetical protein